MELGFDPADLLRLPLYQKIGIGLLILILLMAGYWHLSLGDQQAEIERLEKNLRRQEAEIAQKQRMLLRLPALREALDQLKLEEAKAARILPSKQEIPALLTHISNAGHEQGLEFTLFAPKPEMPVDVYAMVPVDIMVNGPYHETLLFMNQVARLSRIVSFSDLLLKPEGEIVKTQARAMTFRFLEVSERPQKEVGKKGRKSRKRK